MGTTTENRGNRTALAVTGFFLLHVLCCGLPLLIAAGTLGAAGSLLGNPWVIGAAAVLGAAVLVNALRRRASRPAQDGDDCCDPRIPSVQEPARKPATDSVPGR